MFFGAVKIAALYFNKAKPTTKKFNGVTVLLRN
jgi:hypothetical protein